MKSYQIHEDFHNSGHIHRKISRFSRWNKLLFIFVFVDKSTDLLYHLYQNEQILR